MESSKYLYGVDLGLGVSLSEQRGFYIASLEDTGPEYAEITSPEELRDTANAMVDLSSIDWSFTTDDTGFLTHDLHPYPAKFIPQIPGHLISRLSLRGELVFDPFGGSGTTALEAVRLGRRAISIDANPIATLIGKVKTCNLDLATVTDLHSIRCALSARLKELPKDPSLLRAEFIAYIPEIPNIDKWFPITSCGELALIRSRIDAIESKKARNIAQLALSKIILRVSFQDSETRYASVRRDIGVGVTIKSYLAALDDIIRNIKLTQPALRYGVCDFITADVRELSPEIIKDESIDLIVTSPPYGNAMDYHLYHRFRLMWLGYDPRTLAKIEIGSHLRHQKEATGFDAYIGEIAESLQSMYRVTKAGRYAVMVVGDAVYDDILYKGAEAVSEKAREIGFEVLCSIERELHKTKRSFVAPGRRAVTENLVVLRKPTEGIKFVLYAPPYKLWPYESVLRKREIQKVIDDRGIEQHGETYYPSTDPYNITTARKFVFTHFIGLPNHTRESTWQAILENGFANQSAARKDPKYVTHGIHEYKGKFYPQLAKGLLNICGVEEGAFILDPFCGSGTTLLESYLNGYRGFGCDMNPLAAMIAKAKVGILEVNPDILREAVGTLLRKLETSPIRCPNDRSELRQECIEEIESWFPIPVIDKINWLLKSIHVVSDGIIQDFFKVILSDIIRDVSQQEPSDLRIRRRKMPLEDADVFGLFSKGLATQYERIEKFWSIRGYSPNHFYPAKVIEGDSREWSSFERMGLEGETVDAILTSPPYATALPYIDTDRLSLLVLFGLESAKRRPVEQGLIGSREILISDRKDLEEQLKDQEQNLPYFVLKYLQEMLQQISVADVGFRRKNMPALLLRFFQDMQRVIQHCFLALKHNAQAMIVIGDNRIKINGDYERIATTDFIEAISIHCGFEAIERIDISVTTENLVHIKNAITENVVLRLCKP